MNRRGFLIATTAALAAPAIVRASSLMPIAAPRMLRYNSRGRVPPGWGQRGSLIVAAQCHDDLFGAVTYTGDGRELWTLPHSVFGRPELILTKARNNP